MTPREKRKWARAMRLATRILGERKAVSDPLAWWLLTEAVYPEVRP